MKVTFNIDEEVAQEFKKVQEDLKEKYSDDEPFDEDAFIESKIKEFNTKQRKFLGVMRYNDA